MQSTLYLYRNSQILPQRTFMVDDIEEYLNTLDFIKIENYQYQKYEFDMIFKIDKSQVTQEFIDTNNYNYASLENEDGKIVYFFIVDKQPRAQSTIALHVIMDTINTFKPGVDFNVSSRTHILRQHKDRFISSGTTPILSGSVLLDATNYSEEGFGPYDYHYYSRVSIPVNTNYLVASIDVSSQQQLQDQELNYYFDRLHNRLIIELWSEQILSIFYTIVYTLRRVSNIRRNIDYFSEGLTPILYKRESIQLNQENNQNWFLVYRNQNEIDPNNFNQVNPVDCFVVPENETPINIQFGNLEILPSDLEEDYMYLSYSINNKSLWYTAYRNTDAVQSGPLEDLVESGGYISCNILELRKVGTTITATRYLYTINTATQQESLVSMVSDAGITKVVIPNTPSRLGVYSIDEPITASDYENLTDTQILVTASQYITLYGINTIDRTDAKLIKIIEVPYCPLKIVNNEINGPYAVDSFNTTSIKLSNLNQKFNYEFSFNVDTPFRPIRAYSKQITINDYKDVDNESKLYHSDFYEPKFVYDSFGKSFNLEKINYDTYKMIASNNMFVRYTITSTINSRFSFIFPDYTLFISVEDFDNVLTIARNNEKPLYTSQYINYLRTGFNYDVKSKDITKTNAIMTAGGSIVGSIGSIALAVTSQNPFAYASAIFTTVHAITSIVSSVNTIAAAEASFEAKQLQMRNQSISVVGSDDVDIMESYSGNRAYLNTYRVSDRLRNALYKLFFYTGYATDEFGDFNLNTRTRFNFISCDLVIQQGHNLPDYVIADLVDKYRYLTNIHHFNNEWDFEQQYENWEISLGG